jgi:uncharacterized phage protein (TIGR02218 family)
MRDYNITLTDTTLFLVRLVKITRLDGHELLIADAEENIVIGIDEIWEPLPGADISAIRHIINGDMGSMEIKFAHSEGGTLDTAQLNNGFWDGATVQVWLKNRNASHELGDPMFTGLIDTVSLDLVGSSGTFDIRGLSATAEAFIQTFQPMCRTDLFSVLCQLNEDDWDHAGTIATILDRFNFTVAGLASPPDDGWFNQGTFVTGSGFKGVIANWDKAALKVTMYQPQCLARLTSGETITLYAGCDKTAQTCREKFNNRINHQGEAHFLGINSIVGMD